MAWYDSAVFYHIYPLGLCGCSRENTGVAEQHFDKLREWAKHAADLGFNAIYIGPLFESVGHGYETTDYKKVDIRLGTNDDFKDFVAYCHEMDVKVIVDGVFNHVGRRFFAFEDLQKNRESSPYRDWFCNVNFGGNNEYNDGFCYENWGGYNLLVKLNQRNPAVKEYLFDVIRFWVQEFDIDGIRLDAADVLDFDFMKQMRHETDRMKQDFWLMGEVIHGDYSRWVNDETLHAVTNYELHKGLYSGHNDHNYFEIAHSVRRLNDICQGRKLYTFVDNHDVERIYSKLNNKEHVRLVTLLLYTLYGIPSVYYGSEFGIEGKKEKGSDWNLRPCLELADFKDAVRNNPVTKLCGALGRLKKDYEELTLGAYQELYLNNRQFAYGRVLNRSAVITALNSDDNAAVIEFNAPVDGAQVADLLGLSEDVVCDGGRVCVTLPANTGTVLLLGERAEATEAESVAVPENPETGSEAEKPSVLPEDPAMVSGEEHSDMLERVEGAGEVSDQAASENPDAAQKQEETPGGKPRLAGLTIMVEDLGRMVWFYRDVLGFAIEQQGSRAYLKRDGVILVMYARRDFERLTCRGYGYGGGVTGHFHVRLTVENVDAFYQSILGQGAQSVLEPGDNEWGEHIAYAADPEGNIIELTAE